METLLKASFLSGGYYKNPVLKDVSLKIEKGDFLGIIGPNGSGKTTLLRLMTKVIAPQKGKVELSGVNICAISLKDFCKKVAFVPQDTLINFTFSVLEIVLLGRIPHLKRLQLETKEDMEKTLECMRLTETLALKEKNINELSAGERQRVMLAKALAQEPALLFLDEPTSHLDIGHQTQILDLLRKFNRNNNLTIAMVLHDLNLASEYCNRIILLNEGKIFKEGQPREVLTYQTIEAVYKTVVVVENNPINNKPYIVLVSKEGKCQPS